MTVSTDAVVPPSAAPTSNHDFPLLISSPRSRTRCPRIAPANSLLARRLISPLTFNRPAKTLPMPNLQTPRKAAPPGAFSATGNLNQLMRGIMFPNSNIIFTVQTHDPAEKKKTGDAANATGGFNWSMWGSDLYSGWEIVDYASIALADSAPLLLTPGRRCENGKPVPVNDPDWIRFTKEMAEVGRAAYRASQTRNQEKVSDVTGDVADACLHCHQVFRDKMRPGRTAPDPSDKDLRCTKN